MTGKYRIDLTTKLGKDADKRNQKAWSTFVSTCESLHRDGLEYEVSFCYWDTAWPVIRIKAYGTPKARRATATASRAAVLTPRVTEAVAKQRGDEAAQFIEYTQRTAMPHPLPKKNKSRYWELDGLARQGREFIEAELEYWRELELLSGQRQHHKPGLSETAEYQDDEVAA